MQFRIVPSVVLFCLSAGSAFGQTFNLHSSLNPSLFGQQITISTDNIVVSSRFIPTATFTDSGTPIGSAVADAVTGIATLTLPNLAAGTHSIVACTNNGNGQGTFCSNGIVQSVVMAQTQVALSSSVNPSTPDQTILLTANVSALAPSNPDPSSLTGSILFFDGSTQIGTSTIISGTTATLLRSFGAGSHSLTAQFPGNANFRSSISPVLSQVVTTPTTLTLASSINPSTVGEPTFLTAAISPATATGTIRFFDGATQIGSVAISNGLATTPVAFQSTGNHSLTAQLVGTFAFSASTSPVLMQVVAGSGASSHTVGNTSQSTLSTVQGQSFTPSTIGNRGIGVPQGSGGVTLIGMSFDFQTPANSPLKLYIYPAPPTIDQVNNNGQGSLGTALNSGAGIYLFSGLVLDVNTQYFAVLSTPASIFESAGDQYAGGADLFAQPVGAPTAVSEGGTGFDTGFTATFQASQSSSATITSLSASPVSPSTHQPINMTANVLPSAAIGTVNFMDGAALLGSATLANGQATLTVGPLTAGNHSLTAVYAGSTRFAGSMSAPFNESVSAGPLTGVWTITQSHVGAFSAAQPQAFFTITVMNTVGTGPTTGTVTVTEFPSGNLNGFIILSGANWNCAALSCTRSDSLAVGASYPPITVSVTLAADGSTTVPNMATVAGGGLTSASSTDTANVTPAFTDVLSTDSFLPAIDLLRESGITKGCSPTTYCGDASITQAQMAVFIVRSVLGTDNFTFTQTPFFTDEPASDVFFPFVQKMQDLGIALSCGTGLFCPNAAVTRAQMAVLIIRARYGLANPPNVPAGQAFTDVLPADMAFPFVQKMKQVGITTGCSPTTYCPNDPVTRGQMAVFLMRGMFNLVPSPPNNPPLLSLSQSNIVQGTSATFTIQGQNSHFSSGTTQVSAGPGITVSNVSVANATTLSVQFAAAVGAATGPRSVVVTTGNEEATLPNVLTVIPHP